MDQVSMEEGTDMWPSGYRVIDEGTPSSRREPPLRHRNRTTCGPLNEQSCLDGSDEVASSEPCGIGYGRRSSLPNGRPRAERSLPPNEAPRAKCRSLTTCKTNWMVTLAAILLCSSQVKPTLGVAGKGPPVGVTTLFVTPLSRRSSATSYHPSMSILSEKNDLRRSTSPGDTPTWSNAVRQSSNLNESRFGVRKRVKSVLSKAKKRTGVNNVSMNKEREYSRIVNGEKSSFIQTGPNVVAETASIGGLGDVALDYISTLPREEYNNTGNLETELEVKSTGVANGSQVNQIVGSKRNGVDAPTHGREPDVTNETPSLSPSTFQQPEDEFVIREAPQTQTKTFVEKEAFTGDVSAAFSLPREPLPFKLPALDSDQHRRVKAGERVQFQDDMGRAGSGFVVWDVKAPPSVVWDCLLDFKSYPQTIPTVREVVMYTNTHLKEDYRAEKPVDFEDGTAAICKHGVPSVTRAQFSLSKFRLKIAALHKYRPHPKGDYMIFTLDPASRNMALKYAKGIWYTQSNPEGKEGYTRVWLLCELRVSKLLPQWIVDYAASRAMPRATTWLKPQTETAAELWLKDRKI